MENKDFELSRRRLASERELALLHLSEFLGFNLTEEWLRQNECALLRIRHKAIFLPEMDNWGNMRDESKWVYISMCDKIDSGEYGQVYYF